MLANQIICAPYTGQRTKDKSEKGTGLGPVPQAGSCERGKVPAPWEAPSPSGRSMGTERELCRLRGEYNNWFVAGRTERPT